MNKTKKIYVILMLCIIAIVCSFVTSNSLFSSAEESSLSSVYEWNSSIVIPSSTIEYKGQSYDATDISLKFPSGIYKSGKKQILDEIDMYIVPPALGDDSGIKGALRLGCLAGQKN